ncbi:MAG: chemotaxis protein CheB [Chitinophagaceae bacterium]
MKNTINKVLLVAGSAGSLDAILILLSSIILPADASVVVIVHRKGGDDGQILVDLLKDKTHLNVKEAEEKEAPLPQHIYIAPGDYHLLFEADFSFSLDYSEKINYSRPSIDVSFQSAATAFGSKATAILLSGANSDGTEGLVAIKANGGTTIVQDPATASISLMPEHAVKYAAPEKVLPVAGIVTWLNQRKW